MKFLRAFVLAIALSGYSLRAMADNPGREFLMSCTYGVITGTLVGVASLAFTSDPANNLHLVARGASLGLYAGILLGLYVVYIVPGLDATPEDDNQVHYLMNPRFDVSLTQSPRGSDGLQADVVVMHF